ncbi:cytochrome P450 [Hoyosella rhizosphaerae]|uniref:Cytochrome P450 n=1 Tax=Hoyosella rhizosphaerae TaxID=1755582 RepID=A0A916U161_9ACTN|nr:cytochrome P450 [Hoyosella rhizosphaerae]MBN4926888.1 cytochrome P450 [Hoyosella rhizosphaerae]GGC55729.1 hypothetical protein GCM10011410_05160 [Hoyosella rhizosphaerae]
MQGRSTELFGEDAHEFNPKRFDDAAQRRALATNVKPFGTGVRACLGRALATQELVIAMSALIRDYRFSDPSGLIMRDTLGLRPQSETLDVVRERS